MPKSPHSTFKNYLIFWSQLFFLGPKYRLLKSPKLNIHHVSFLNIFPGLGDKKKYYVEILIDDKLYARTSSKKITDACCMWCESFSFADLPQTTEKITLLVHKDKGGQSTSTAPNSRKKPKKPVGRVKISVGSVTSR